MTAFQIVMEWLFMIKDRWLFGNWETRSIFLSNGDYAVVDAEDYHRLAHHTWHATSWKTVIRNFAEQQVMLKREVLGFPDTEVVFNKNGNGFDCRKENLLACSHSEHHARMNYRGARRSRYRGVHWDKYISKYRARITVHGKVHYLGVFENEEDAARAYNAAAREHFNVFAQLNKIGG